MKKPYEYSKKLHRELFGRLIINKDNDDPFVIIRCYVDSLTITPRDTLCGLLAIISYKDLFDKYVGIEGDELGEISDEYIYPKRSFIGRIDCEATDIADIENSLDSDWEKKIYIGLHYNESSRYPYLTSYNNYYAHIRVKKFSYDNPPPVGARFTENGVDYNDVPYDRFFSTDVGIVNKELKHDHTLFVAEDGYIYAYDGVTWIDFSDIPMEEEN